MPSACSKRVGVGSRPFGFAGAFAGAFAGTFAACAIVPALVALAACAPDPAPLRIARIIVDGPRVLDGKLTLREGLREEVRKRIEADGSVQWVRSGREATHVLRLLLGFDRAGASQKRVSSLQLELQPVADQPVFAGAASIDTSREPLAALLQGFDSAWRVVQRQRRLESGQVADMIGALKDPDTTMRAFAISRLGQRHVVDAVDPLCALLDSEQDALLVLRAVGSLVAIGDTRAVKPLIDTTMRREPAFVLQVVFAVAAIGGRTAKAFLLTLAEGHSDAEVRRGASDALKEMERRGATARPGG